MTKKDAAKFAMKSAFIKKILLLKNSKNLRNFIAHNKNIFLKRNGSRTKGAAVVLFELNNMQSAHIAYSYLANVLAKIYDANIIAYLPQTRVSTWNKLILNIKKILCIGEFGVYKSFGITGFKWTSLSSPQRKKAQKLLFDIYKNINDKWDIERIAISGVILGDLIYDSYLKKFNRPTIDSASIEFKNFLCESIEAFICWEDYFNSNDVKAVNVSHCVYNLAIPLRLAIAREIPAFQSNATHIYRLNKNNYFAYSDYKYFPQTFAQLPNATKLEGIAESKRRIDQRFSGQTGVDMAYSTKSAYGQKKNAPLLIKSDRPKILVATHCFYDSPHSYGNNLFPDFYEWLEFLGKIAELTNYDWYIKTHPDFIPGTKEVIDNFIDKYPKFILLPPDSSHHQIIEEGIDVALTVYGTIGFEYAALGIPVINCSLNNPHIAYNFNLHPKNVDQYKDLLMNLSTKKLNIDIHEVYEYYYMKNIYNTEDLFFKNYQRVIKKLGGYSKQFTDDIYDFWISEWTPEKNRKILNGIEVYVLSGDFRMNYKHIQ